jgi:hypothetical protein
MVLPCHHPNPENVILQDLTPNMTPNILSTSWVVNGKIAFANNLGFLAQIDDLYLKCCILGENSRNTISGSNIARNPNKRHSAAKLQNDA